MTIVFGHRGAAGTYPENTLLSFQAAFDEGAKGIELDVQLASDGTVVVIHDEKIDRTTTGKGYVKDFTYHQLRKFDASFKFHDQYGFVPIPSLQEVLEWVKPLDLLINIELKNGIIEYPTLEEKVLELINEFQIENRVIISSFNHYSLKKCKIISKNVETAILYMEGLYEPWSYATTVEANALHPYIPAATAEITRKAQLNGFSVRPFTVNDESIMKRLFNEQVAGFFTDYPRRAMEVYKML
ncbi:glycerophosphodiester phosphodiesterase [Bacillus sp. HMF5848]|uniref:glycerophosphodiester phosphodiesterase n=1 Tax=Bacillus sp. HMF5848 TaxID=2495421 RepID=UPI000F7A4588|nr:glycerophosphodiester phosphodiesterase [Bacillus sp. HMF5848]RSK29377.1 glycerophosphodiester phosphodiesterase [Bacillus sp. HMF5848]